MNPDPENLRDLALLDALGEATPEQRVRLATALCDNPTLAAEHAAMCRAASRLSEPPPATLSPMPADLTAKLDTMHPVAPNIVPFPSLRRLIPFAAAASIALLATLAWRVARSPHEDSRPTLAEQRPGPASTPKPDPQYQISGGSSAPSASPITTGGHRRAVIAAAECATKEGARPPAAVKARDADARKFRSLLISQYGFKDSDIVTLINEEATSARIVSAINKHLIAQSQPGDVAVFMFSGHGTQVQDFDGDEDDGVDEAICPWDHDWSKVESWLTDDVIGNMAARLSRTNLLVVMDSCHAGTMTRGVGDDEQSAPMGVDSGFRPKPGSPPKPTQGIKLKYDPPPDEKLFKLPDQYREGSGSPPTPKQLEQTLRQGQKAIEQLKKQTDFDPPASNGVVRPLPNPEQELFPLKQIDFNARLRQAQQPGSPTYYPETPALQRTADKFFRAQDGDASSWFTNEDVKTLDSAEAFLRMLKDATPEDKLLLKTVEKFGIMAKEAVQRAGSATTRGAQVLLAATTADRYGWFSYAEGSHFLRHLEAAMSKASAETTFADLVTQITPGIEKSAREAMQDYAKKTDRNPDDPAFQQKPEAEGATTARVRDFLRGFSVTAPPPSPGLPPAPTPQPITLNTWQQASGDIAVALSTDKLTYAEGDLLEITITADRDCHLRLFYLGADHQTYQIFPNQHQPEAAVKKGETVRLGGPGGAFKLRAKAPFGNEILMAVASSRPFTDTESFRFQTDLVKEFQNTNLESLGHRGIGVEPGDTPLVGRALRLYRVEAKK